MGITSARAQQEARAKRLISMNQAQSEADGKADQKPEATSGKKGKN